MISTARPASPTSLSPATALVSRARWWRWKRGALRACGLRCGSGRSARRSSSEKSAPSLQRLRHLGRFRAILDRSFRAAARTVRTHDRRHADLPLRRDLAGRLPPGREGGRRFADGAEAAPARGHGHVPGADLRPDLDRSAAAGSTGQAPESIQAVQPAAAGQTDPACRPARCGGRRMSEVTGFDVAVIGGGVIGTSIAYHAAEARHCRSACSRRARFASGASGASLGLALDLGLVASAAARKRPEERPALHRFRAGDRRGHRARHLAAASSSPIPRTISATCTNSSSACRSAASTSACSTRPRSATSSPICRRG